MRFDFIFEVEFLVADVNYVTRVKDVVCFYSLK